MLNQVERDVLSMRLVEHVPVAEVASMLRLSAVRIEKIQRQALDKVRGHRTARFHGGRHRIVRLTPKLARYI